MLWGQHVRRNDQFSLNQNINVSVVFLSGVWWNILQLWQPWHQSNQQIEFLPRGWYRYKCVWHFVSYWLWIARAEQEIESWRGVWSERWRWSLFQVEGTWCQRLSPHSVGCSYIHRALGTAKAASYAQEYQKEFLIERGFKNEGAA